MAKTAAPQTPEVENPAVVIEDDIPAAAIDINERLVAADKVVRRNSYWAAGIGTIPVPIVDFIGVGAIQLRMSKQISELYGVTFCENAAKNIIGALVGTIGGGLASRMVLASLIKTLPFAGAVVGGVIALPIISGAATYALGRVFVRHFESGGDLLNLSPERMKSYFREQYDAGKAVVTKAVKRDKSVAAAPSASVAEEAAAAGVATAEVKA